MSSTPPSQRQYLSVPNFNSSVQSVGEGKISQAWYRFFNGLIQGTPPSDINTLQLTGSPFSFVLPYMGYVIANGGTISSVTLLRDPAQAPLPLPLTGVYHASKGDTLIFTYSAAPTLQFVPQ